MDDLINRQAALDCFHDWIDKHGNVYCADESEEYQRIEALPSASQWIPCSERMPDGAFGCLVTVWDTNPVTMDEFENILPYFVGWDGEQWNDADGEQCPFEVIAWMPLPEPYKGETDG